MYAINESLQQSNEKLNCLRSNITNTQDLNTNCQEKAQESAPISFSIIFERSLYPRPVPVIFVTTISSYCPPTTYAHPLIMF